MSEEIAKHTGSLRIWRPADHKSLELRLGTSFRHSYPRHWHDEFFISAITDGAGHFLYGGRDHLATPGTLVFVAPGEVHAHHDCNGGRSFRSLHMAPSFVAEVGSQLLQCNDPLSNFHSSLISDPDTLHLFLKLHRSLEKPGSRLHGETRILEFFTRLRRHIDKQRGNIVVPGRERAAVRCALEYLHAHYDQAISLRDLATLANMSPYYFHRVFSRATGMPPHGYLIQLRIMRAKVLLETWPIASVAALTGFVDQTHFTRQFRRQLGITPAQYAGVARKY